MSLGPSYPGIRSSIPGTTSDAVSPVAGSLNANGGGAPILPDSLNIKKRRLSKMKPGKHLPRSKSTPHLRDKFNIMSDSDADKKRNKLGYQRISIACGAHCRRRKIRCLVAEGDPQSRCQNCIRLKKECVFYPVDQQSAIENRHDPSHKSGHPPGPSPMSSMTTDGGASNPNLEQSHLFVAPPTLQSHGSSTFEGLPIDPGNAFPVRGWPPGPLLDRRQSEHVPGAFSQPEYSYDAPQDGGNHWGAGGEYPGHMTTGPVESIPAFFGRFNNHTVPGDFAPFPINEFAPHAQAPHHQQYNFGNAPQPMRSVTHGSIQSLPSMNPHHPMQTPQHSQIRYGQPPSLNPHVASMQPHDLGPQSAPVAYGQAHPYMAHQGHARTGSTSMSSHPAYAGNFFGAQPEPPIEEEQEYWQSQRPI
ncbi:GAL4-like Zn(II)2Cys6 (or C6 zinc) binuclear cluster DNA-binding domain [Teratosphaeria destructans]|uniref:GAL4-like Zn(II)2Cys6 (Or C6 zinc) binuclear cluster DNA-binding domain n=1 Tax=Teratosphaeria destructans TaxID=418781 RepID=A0A9W7VZD7_9PEZI|nr:GAL4-like Zn(II)2Cys6 (or C6 zinc) binuclear cluster DNA-binding domain [Teratosphaeria destructans]